MITYRSYKTNDENEISTLIRRSLVQVIGKDYSEYVIKCMVDYFSPEAVKELALKRDILVALDESKIVGVASLENDTVYTVCIDPPYLCKGIGKELMRQLEELAKKRGITSLKVPSSIMAVEFYQKLGYSKDKDLQIQHGSLTVNMTKNLN